MEKHIALQVNDNSLEPELKSGEIALVDIEAETKPGDFVAVKFKSGKECIKRIKDIRNTLIYLNDLPAVNKSDIIALHKVTGKFINY